MIFMKYRDAQFIALQSTYKNNDVNDVIDIYFWTLSLTLAENSSTSPKYDGLYSV